MRAMPQRVILLQPLAPAKPAPGAACNGCGVCCAAEPCPLGHWLSAGNRGPCQALSWDEASRRYHCGALAAPERWLSWLPRRWALGLARRWIAAGAGCDCDYEVQSGAPDEAGAR